MRTLIEGGWVVAFDGVGHEVYEQGAVVFENDRIVHAGGPYAGPADARISARGKLVSPGFINTHVHPAGNGGDYLLLDMAKNDYRTANYMSFAAPLKGRMAPPPPEATAALRAYVFLHALKNGTTTVIDVGGLRGDWDGYARLVDDLGVRVYASPPFRDRDTYMDAQGRLTCEEDPALGRPVDAGAAVDHARLARAVRADQRRQPAALDREGHVVQRAKPGELERHPLDAQVEPDLLRRLVGYESQRRLRR